MLVNFPHKFSILFPIRTGSTVLQTSLNNHPSIICGSEDAFNQQIVFPMRKNGTQWPDSKSIGISFPLTYEFETHSGMKIPIGLSEFVPLTHPFWSEVFGHKVIFCLRNLVEVFISMKLVAENGDHWRLVEYQNPIKFNSQEAKEFITYMTGLIQKIISRCSDIRFIHYADGPQRCYRKALDYLGVEHFPQTTHITKQRTKPIEELISNYKQVECELKELQSQCEQWLQQYK